MHDKRKRVNFLPVNQNIQLHKPGFFISLHVIIKRGISPGPGFQCVKEIIYDFIQGKFIFQQGTPGLHVFHAQITSPPLLAEFHYGPDKLAGHHDFRAYHRLLHMLDQRGIRQVGRICQFHDFPVCLVYFIDYARRRGHQIQIIFPFQPLLNDFQMQQPQKSAAESKSQSHRGLRLILQGRVIELQLLQGVPQIRIARAVCRIESAVNHGLYFLIAGQGAFAGIVVIRHGVTHRRVFHILDGCSDIAHHPGR